MLYGYIFEWDGFLDKTSSTNFEEFVSSLEKTPNLSFAERLAIRSHKGWGKLWLRSSKALLGEQEDNRQNVIPGTEMRRYPVHVRVNERTKTVILAGQRYLVTDSAVLEFNSFVTPNLRRRVIDIDRLSRRLMSTTLEEKHFCVTYFMADVPGYGTALSTISLHGDDVGAVDFLAAERTNFTARQLGVRTIKSRIEAGRFVNTGSVQFRIETVPDMEAFLRYTYAEGLYID